MALLTNYSKRTSGFFNMDECPKHASVKDQFSHQVIFDFLASGNQKVPDCSDKTWQIRLEFFVVLLRVQSSVVTYLRLEQLQETRFLLILTRDKYRR